jgi:CRP/FNR family transcriptional regulator, transcriptional activator FtrB
MALSTADVAALKRLPLFASVDPAVCDGVLQNARLHDFAVGSVLFREGEPAEWLNIALDGHVVLKTKDGSGRKAIIEFVGPGQPFIVAAVLLAKPFLMTAQVVESSRIVLIPADGFRHAVEGDLSLSAALNRVTAENWRSLVGQVKSIKMRTASQRLAAFLVSLVDKRNGEATVQLPCERRMLAAWLGMVPTSASRAFRDLASLGVEGRGRRLRIRSLGRLAEYADMNF